MGAAIGVCSTATIDPPSVAIVLDLQSPIPACAVEEMMLEVERIFQPTNETIAWRELSTADAGETFHGIYVIKLRGSCGLWGFLLDYREPPPSAELKPLGCTTSTDRQILPFATLFCDRVSSLIMPELAGLDAEHRDRALGRALGRVLAHELFHMITRSSQHSRRGIVKSYYTRHDLAADSLRFEPAQIEMIRRQIGHRENQASNSGF